MAPPLYLGLAIAAFIAFSAALMWVTNRTSHYFGGGRPVGSAAKTNAIFLARRRRGATCCAVATIETGSTKVGL